MPAGHACCLLAVRLNLMIPIGIVQVQLTCLNAEGRVIIYQVRPRVSMRVAYDRGSALTSSGKSIPSAHQRPCNRSGSPLLAFPAKVNLFVSLTEANMEDESALLLISVCIFQ